MLMHKKILITGGAGFIGSALVRLAIARGHDVVNLDSLTYAANPDNLTSVEAAPGYRFVKGDIGDAALVARLLAAERPDAIMNLAAETHVDRSIDAPRRFLDTNILGTHTLLAEALRYYEGAPQELRDRFVFHHVSTDEVYGSLGPEGLFSETSPYAPNSPYAAAKASSDFLVRAWHRTYGLPVITTNCSNNYGPCQFPEKFIPLVILSALEGRRIPVYGNGENVRDWLHVEDHARGLLLALEKGVPGETYNIGADEEWRNIDLAETLCDLIDEMRPGARPCRELIAFVTDRPGHDARYAIDSDKIRRDLGWTPEIPMTEGLRRTVRWYLDNEDWWRAVRARGFDEGVRLGVAPAASPQGGG